MNERIKELARKAGMVEVRYSPGFPDIRYPENFEKFAELIVRECADNSRAHAANNSPTLLANMIATSIERRLSIR